MCPRNDGISTPFTTSVGDVRGFANWPAMRPTLTTGSVAAYVSTADICSSTLSRSRIAGSGDVVERLDAVAGLQQESAPLAYLAERREQRARLAREDEGRQAAQPLAYGRERVERRASPAAARPRDLARTTASRSSR